MPHRAAFAGRVAPAEHGEGTLWSAACPGCAEDIAVGSGRAVRWTGAGNALAVPCRGLVWALEHGDLRRVRRGQVECSQRDLADR